jgi:hypothetical protein
MTKSDFFSRFMQAHKSYFKETLSLILTFDHRPEIDELAVRQRLLAFEPLNNPDAISIVFEGRDQELTAGKTKMIGQIHFDDHGVNLLLIEAPLPATVLEKTVQTASFAADTKSRTYAHQFHVVCFYIGKNPDVLEQYIAMYKVAVALNPDRLTGIINEMAGTFVPESIAKKLLEPTNLAAIRMSYSPMLCPLFISTLRLARPEGGVWAVTNGGHVFGVKDLAFLAEDHAEAHTAHQDLLSKIMLYMIASKVSLNPGHTMEAGPNTFVKFGELFEYHDYLERRNGTLTVEYISESEVI